MKNLTFALLCIQTLVCMDVSGSFGEILKAKQDLRSSQEIRTQRSFSTDDEVITFAQSPQKKSNDDDDDDDSSSRKEKGKKKDTKKAEGAAASSSSASTGIFGDDDVVFGSQDEPQLGASSQSIANSVDMSISTITQKAKENKDLSAEELKNIALAILKKQTKSGENRRSLSKKRLEADKKISSTREALEKAEQNFQQALAEEASVRQLEADAKGNQERIKGAMQLLYSAIMNDPQITEEIKEQWQDAKKPGGKLSLWEKAFSGCLLL